MSPASRRFCLLALLWCGMAATPLHAVNKSPERRLEDSRDYAAAKQAMADGLFDVSAVKAERLLKESGWSKKSQVTFATLLVESLVRGGRGKDALTVIKEHEIADQAFWSGQAMLLTGDFEQASAVFETYQGKLSEFASIGRAHALLGDGRDARVRGQIKALRESPNAAVAYHTRLFFNEMEASSNTKIVLDRLSREKGDKDAVVQYLRARSLLELNENKKAEAVLRDLLLTGAAGMGPAVHDAATILLAESLWRQHAPDARQMIVAFLNSFGSGVDTPADTEFWGEAFALLERIATAAAPDPALLPVVLDWCTQATQSERQGYALNFIANELHRSGRDTEAIGLLEALLQLYPHHPKASDAMRLAMQLHGTLRADTRVLQLAERWQREFGGGGESVVDFLTGIIHFMRGEYREALLSFTKAADIESDLTHRRRALYNAAISAVNAGEKKVLNSVMVQLAQVSPPEDGKKSTPPLRDTAADLMLDKALQLAARLDPSAENELTSYLSKNPEHSRRIEAQLALAEFRLLDVPPRVKEATEALDAAAATAPEPAMQERIAYVRVWLHEAAQELTNVVREAQTFLATWPESARADEVRMKLAESYYRLESYARARTEFELLATNHPNSPYADSALYFAGMSAMALTSVEGLNAAISTWGDLVQRGGPLTFAARQQQAIAMSRKGDFASALKLYELLFDAPEASNEQRLALRSEKAELLLSMGKKEPARTEEAIQLLRQTLEQPSLPYAWSARCGVLLARALRDVSRNTEALEACYNVINVGTSVVSAPSNPTEYLWFYRAGFLAIDLLEDAQQWEAAARMAERLAQSGGDRARDAAERASKIRLKHFLWESGK